MIRPENYKELRHFILVFDKTVNLHQTFYEFGVTKKIKGTREQEDKITFTSYLRIVCHMSSNIGQNIKKNG